MIDAWRAWIFYELIKVIIWNFVINVIAGGAVARHVIAARNAVAASAVILVPRLCRLRLQQLNAIV